MPNPKMPPPHGVDPEKGSKYEREDLQEETVTTLREIAREVCGPGTWIAHARKHELIDAIVKGRPPKASETDSTYYGRTAPSLQGLPVEDAEELAHNLLRLMRKATAPDLARVRERVGSIERRLEEVEQAIAELEEELSAQARETVDLPSEIRRDMQDLSGVNVNRLIVLLSHALADALRESE